MVLFLLAVLWGMPSTPGALTGLSLKPTLGTPFPDYPLSWLWVVVCLYTATWVCVASSQPPNRNMGALLPETPLQVASWQEE